MIDFLLSLPLWALAAVLNVWLIGFALLTQWVLRRWVLPRLRMDDDAALFYGLGIMSSALVLYGLVAALTAVSVWQRYAQVEDIVSSEATAISALWRDFGGYPQGERDAMQDILRLYTEQVIQGAWPAQRQGRIPNEGVVWMNRLQMELFAYEPRSEAQKLLHGEALSAYNRLAQARRLRIDAVKSGLPGVMWFVLMPGAMACVVLALFVRLEDPRLQAILVAGLAGFMAMVLFVIISLDYPFRGPMSISSDSYQLVHDQLMKGQAE